MRLTGLAEQFQAAYSIATNWENPDKTVCFTLGVPLDYPPPSVTFQLPTGEQEVTFTGDSVFLKTAFLNPGTTMARVLDEIDKFPLPRQRNLPLSLIRRAVIGLLIPRIRGILNIHPLPVKMAEELDLALVKKISRALGVEFRNSTLLFLPLDQLGFGFPSLFRINGELVIAALLRLLD